MIKQIRVTQKNRTNNIRLLFLYCGFACVIIGLYLTSQILIAARNTQEASAATILPVSHWKGLFDSSSMSLTSGEGLRCQTRSLNLIVDENLYHFGACIDGLTSMYLATKETKYIDRALLYLNTAISTAKNDNRGYKGWDTNSPSLDVSHGWRSVARFLYTIKNTAPLYGNSTYRDQYNSILAFSEKNVFEKYYTDSISRESTQSSGAVNGSLIYRGRTHMTSHWPYMAMYFRRLSANSTAIARYDEVISKFDRGLSPYAQSSLRQQLVPNKNVPTAIFFSDRWERFDGLGSDMHHAQDTIGYMIDAFELGQSEWTEIDIFKLRETLKKVIWKGTASGEWQVFAGFMDGSNGNSDTIIDGKPVDTSILGRCQEDGFLKLGRYDSQIQEIMQSHSPRGCMAIGAYGNMALNTAMLTSRGRDLRNFSEQEVKNSYDTIVTIQKIQAESYSEAKGIENKGAYISSFDTGDWVKYENVNMNNAKQFKWTVNGRNGQNYFQVRLDSPTGAVISYLHTQPQDDSSSSSVLMRELVSPITTSVSGNRTIYLTAGPYYGVANIDSFEIQSRSSSNTPVAPEPSPSTKPIASPASAKPTPSIPNVTPTASPLYNQDNVQIRARGTAAKNSTGVLEYPRMQLIINDKIVSEFVVSDSYQDYKASTEKVIKAQLHYLNDSENDIAADRNIQIDYLRVNNTIYQSESPQTYSIGSWSSSGCEGGFKRSEWLHCVGYFDYSNQLTPQTESIQAEAYTNTGGKVVIAGQESKPGVLTRDGYLYRFDPNDYVTYTLTNPLKTYQQVTLYLKSRNNSGTIEILAGTESGKLIGSKTGFSPSGLTLPEWQTHTIPLQVGSFEGNNVTLIAKDTYEIAYIDKLVFSR